MRHLVHPQWQTTYCGLALQGVHSTTTMIMVTCRACKDNSDLLNLLEQATPADFSEGSK